MLPTSTMLLAATHMLQQTLAARSQTVTGNAGDALLIGTANGAAGLEPGANGLLQARGRITEALFSTNSVDPLAMKMRLIERVGEQLGISMDDFDSQLSYGLELKRATSELSQFDILALEKELGLDELGITLDTLINAIIDPAGEDDDRLDAALAKEIWEGSEEGR